MVGYFEVEGMLGYVCNRVLSKHWSSHVVNTVAHLYEGRS